MSRSPSVRPRRNNLLSSPNNSVITLRSPNSQTSLSSQNSPVTPWTPDSAITSNPQIPTLTPDNSFETESTEQQLNFTFPNAAVNVEVYKLWIREWRRSTSIKWCGNCYELLFARTDNIQRNREISKCERNPRKWNEENYTCPKNIPNIFKRFPMQSVNCIRLINPVPPIVDKRGSFRGTVMNFENPPQKLSTKLPTKSKYILTDSRSAHGKEKRLFVSSHRLTASLRWLVANNFFYRGVEIDATELSNQSLDATSRIGKSDEQAQQIEEQLEYLYNT
ncbi:MAG: hypothetical protein MHMPM18_004129, partial [Marteilia pararefringens]